jgi:hypothetical protein
MGKGAAPKDMKVHWVNADNTLALTREDGQFVIRDLARKVGIPVTDSDVRQMAGVFDVEPGTVTVRLTINDMAMVVVALQRMSFDARDASDRFAACVKDIGDRGKAASAIEANAEAPAQPSLPETDAR